MSWPFQNIALIWHVAENQAAKGTNKKKRKNRSQSCTSASGWSSNLEIVVFYVFLFFLIGVSYSLQLYTVDPIFKIRGRDMLPFDNNEAPNLGSREGQNSLGWARQIRETRKIPDTFMFMFRHTDSDNVRQVQIMCEMINKWRSCV